MTITDFLLARINEDEAAANTRSDDAPIHYSGCYYYNYTLDANWFCDCKDIGDDPTARLLAECRAKRAIIDFITGEWDSSGTPIEVQGTYYLAQALAAIYATHPDYQQEWAN